MGAAIFLRSTPAINTVLADPPPPRSAQSLAKSLGFGVRQTSVEASLSVPSSRTSGQLCGLSMLLRHHLGNGNPVTHHKAQPEDRGVVPSPCWHSTRPHRIILLALSWLRNTCRGKELSFGLRTHWNIFIIPTSWRAGARGGPLRGEDITDSSHPEVPHHL